MNNIFRDIIIRVKENDIFFDIVYNFGGSAAASYKFTMPLSLV